jgi:CHAT domain-containing protein/tetratricopeptide (TPR) repeat protein
MPLIRQATFDKRIARRNRLTYNRSIMRVARLPVLPPRAVLVLALSALAAGLSAQTTRLKLGKTVPGDLSEGQTHSYSIKLKANQYLRAVVTQPVVGPVIELDAPDGKHALEVESRDFPGKPSLIVWVAEASGEYRIKVSGVGHYEIKVEELRAAGTADRKRVEAERSFTQGLSEARSYAYEQALLSYTRALGLYREIQDHKREADTLSAAGVASRGASQYEKAIDYYEQALALYREAKDTLYQGVVLNRLGTAYASLSQDAKAIGYWEQALAIFHEIGDRRGERLTLINMGIADEDLGQYEKAVASFEQALGIAREIKDLEGEGAALGNLGATYNRLSQYERAIENLDRALAIAREVKNRHDEGNALNELGNAHFWLSQYEKAVGYYEQSLAIDREIRDHLNEGTDLGNLGLAYSGLNQNEKAISYYEQALMIAREIKDRFSESRTLNHLGGAYRDLNQYEKAMSYFEQALAIEREFKDRDGESLTLGNIGAVYDHLSQQEKAIGYFTKALAISREVKDRRAEAEELSQLMDAWQASGQPRLAIFYGKQAVNIVQSIRSDIGGLGQDLQQSFRKGFEKPYHTLAEALIAQGRLAEAEQVLALLKEEEYFQYIRRDAGEASSLNRRADLTPEEAEYEKRYREIGDRLMTIGVERGDLLSKKELTPEQSQHLVQLEQDLAAGNEAFEHFLGDLTQHFSAKPEMTGRIETLRETQGIMEDLRELPAGTVAIFTLIGEDKFSAILRTPDAQKAYEYPIKAADLNRKILEFRQVVQDPALDPRPLAEELYKILIAGMADDLRQAKAQTLMWSLDGALRYVPLAALYDGKQYLIEQYRVSVMTLASNTRLKDRPDQEWKAAGFGVTKAFEDAPALPSVSSELRGIITTKPGDGGVLAGEIELDGQFTQQSMRQTLLKRYPVVHIASHFRFQPGNDAKSFLLLGDGGHLSLADLKTSANLFGGVQLLTLSACNTGVGDGAEVEGFGTLAQRQGAKAVVASLWPVADASTSILMQEFYRIRESSAGITKLEALREAQLELLRGETKTNPGDNGNRGVRVEKATPLDAKPSYKHPYYWAPFFLMGNWL